MPEENRRPMRVIAPTGTYIIKDDSSVVLGYVRKLLLALLSPLLSVSSSHRFEYRYFPLSVYAEGEILTYGSVDGEEKHIGTLIGFVTEEKFHELFSNAVTVNNLKDGISKEPELGSTMVIRKPNGWHKELFPDRPLYEIRIQHIEYL